MQRRIIHISYDTRTSCWQDVKLLAHSKVGAWLKYMNIVLSICFSVGLSIFSIVMSEKCEREGNDVKLSNYSCTTAQHKDLKRDIVALGITMILITFVLALFLGLIAQFTKVETVSGVTRYDEESPVSPLPSVASAAALSITSNGNAEHTV